MPPSPAGVQISGEEVRRRRKLLGDNVVTLAEKVGITFQYLSQIERGTRLVVSPRVFIRICDALGVHVGDRECLIATAAVGSTPAAGERVIEG